MSGYTCPECKAKDVRDCASGRDLRPKEAIKQGRCCNSRICHYFRRFYLSVYERSKYYTILYETFMLQQYLPLVKILKPNTTLIDLGSSIGDTAIYFAQFNEVKLVYAIEKDKRIREIGMNNIKASPFKDKIRTADKIHIPSIIGNVAIKCDIEGDETMFLKEPMPNNVYAVIMETHNTKDKMIDYFKKNGFKADYRFTNEGLIFKELGICLFERVKV